MPSIHVKENEPFDVAIRRFKRICEKEGISGKLRQLEGYEKPSERRKRQHAAAVKRSQKKQQKHQEAFSSVRSRRSLFVSVKDKQAEPTDKA